LQTVLHNPNKRVVKAKHFTQTLTTKKSGKSLRRKYVYRYVGKERDEESGLYYYGARFYAPWLCRFMSCDPLASKYVNQSPYVHADNNPITKVDFNGMGTEEGDNNVTVTNIPIGENEVGEGLFLDGSGDGDNPKIRPGDLVSYLPGDNRPSNQIGPSLPKEPPTPLDVSNATAQQIQDKFIEVATYSAAASNGIFRVGDYFVNADMVNLNETNNQAVLGDQTNNLNAIPTMVTFNLRPNEFINVTSPVYTATSMPGLTSQMNFDASGKLISKTDTYDEIITQDNEFTFSGNMGGTFSVGSTDQLLIKPDGSEIQLTFTGDRVAAQVGTSINTGLALGDRLNKWGAIANRSLPVNTRSRYGLSLYVTP
jgi:RHS repeat-associated protein